MISRWLRPVLQAQPSLHVEIAAALIEVGAAVDISSQPALWGSLLRPSRGPILARMTEDWTYIAEPGTACALVQASLIQALCSIGRERLDLLAIPFRGSAPAAQAVINTLASAKAEGHLVEAVGIGYPLDWEMTKDWFLVGAGQRIPIIEVASPADVYATMNMAP